MVRDFVDDHVETGHDVDSDHLSAEEENGLTRDKTSHILFENEVEKFEEILNESVDVGEN